MVSQNTQVGCDMKMLEPKMGQYNVTHTITPPAASWIIDVKWDESMTTSAALAHLLYG